MDSATPMELARSLKARLGTTSAKAGASSTSPLKSNPSPSSLLLHTTETPSSPHSHQTPNSPLTSQTPSTAQTFNSPPTLETPHSPLPIVAVPLAVASVPSIAPPDKGKRVLTVSSNDDDSDVGSMRHNPPMPHLPTPNSPRGGGGRVRAFTNTNTAPRRPSVHSRALGDPSANQAADEGLQR